MTVVAIVIVLYAQLAASLTMISMIIRDLRGRRMLYWPWERGFWTEWWVDLRLGLLWPWLIYRKLIR